jgi:hypothetical protein
MGALLLALFADSRFTATTFWRSLPGYLALIGHGLSSMALDHTQKPLVLSNGANFTVAATAVGATILALPLYLFRIALVCAFAASNSAQLIVSSAQLPRFPGASASVPCFDPFASMLALILLSRNSAATRCYGVASSQVRNDLPCDCPFHSCFRATGFCSIPWVDGRSSRSATLFRCVCLIITLLRYVLIYKQALELTRKAWRSPLVHPLLV